MVKEVEIRPTNFSDILGQYFGYTSRSSYEDPTRQQATGILSDDGLTLDINLNLNTTAKGFTSTIFLVDYKSIDYAARTEVNTAITDVIVRTSDFLDLNYYSIDLSEVLEIPQTYTSEILDQSINIELFTYESNVSTDYGTRRFSVPYTSTADLSLELNTSTDGIYTVHYANVLLWEAETQYVEGQITVYNSIPYVCITANTGESLSDSYYWETATEDDIREFTSGNTTGRESSSLVTAQFSMLITRKFKQTLIYDLLGAMNYRTEDDESATNLLNLIRNYRELSVIYLEEGDPIKSYYYIAKARTQYNHFKGGKYTLVSNVSNTYTL